MKFFLKLSALTAVVIDHHSPYTAKIAEGGGIKLAYILTVSA
jgi:hypothetical protein